jgi:hypothetical protein
MVYGFKVKWPALFMVFIGAFWALVVGGLIVVPLVGGVLADSLSQFGKVKKLPPAEKAPEDTDEWNERRYAMPEPTTRPYHAPPPPKAWTQQPGVASASGFDWGGFVGDVALRLETVLGPGFSAEGGPSALVLRHGDEVRRVNLGSVLQPPPLDVTERASRACLKMMDEAQLFGMRIKHEPWPVRSLDEKVGPASLPRPRVRVNGAEILLSWADRYGEVVRLDPVQLGGVQSLARPEPKSAW